MDGDELDESWKG